MGYLDEILEKTKKEKADSEKKAGPAKAEAQKTGVKAPEAALERSEEYEFITDSGVSKLYKNKKNSRLLYATPIPQLSGKDRDNLEIIREAATRLITKKVEDFDSKADMRRYYYARIKEIIESAPELGIPTSRIPLFTEAVVREMTGYGLLDMMVEDDNLEEVMVIGTKKPVYVFHRKLGMMQTNVYFMTDDEVKTIIDRIAREVGRRVDIQSPLLDARLPDGSRVNATIPPISLEGPTLTVRKFRADPYSVIDVINFKTMTTELAAFLWAAVDGVGARPANILISGGTSSGKTTTLNVLASFVPENERVITIEDTAELLLPLEHWIRLETRPPSMEGVGEISIDILVKNSLRMRPDRIIVGEVRHKEAFTMFTAMNTGHDGCMGTIHSNSAADTIVRITSPPMSVPILMVSALNFVVVQNRINSRKYGVIRRITEVAEVYTDRGVPLTKSVFEWDPATDTVKRVNQDTRYEKMLREFTALSKETLDSIIEGRKKFLDDLKLRDIKDLPTVKRELMTYVRKESESILNGAKRS
jgi:flagellar protein FlaI